MRKRIIATISRHGSIIWTADADTIDIDTITRVQMFAEDVAHYQSTKEG